jgi:vacuolar-type H+-ATPase subunit I/STV1
MNYKAYTQDPHIALLEIKKAFDDEKPYKAQSLCLAYFSCLENQRHINKALDYASKDDVYKYVSKHMNGCNDTVSNVSEYIEEYKERLEELRQQSKEYKEATTVLEKFCVDNKIDLDSLIEQYLKKSKEELIEANKAVNERQANMVATSKDVAPMPTPEEYEKLMQADSDYKISLLQEGFQD